MEVTKEFITNFHNLKGFTIGEKRKSLFLLLESVKSLDSNSLDLFISSVTPKDYLESLFRIEILIRFKRTEELFEVLKNEREDLSIKILRQPWFFQEPFDNLTPEFIVDKLLPHLSFVIRNKVIKRLAKYNKDEVKCNQLFDLLLERYGINSAQQILRGCSVKKCIDIFETYRQLIRLSSADLIPMFNKNPHSFEIYVGCCEDYLDEHRRIVQEVILKEPDMYLNISEKFSCIDLGKRSTRRLLIHSQEKIISKTFNSSNLHLRTVYKALSRANALLYLQNLFPENQREFYYNTTIKKFLKYFPKAEQFFVFTNTFERVYKKTIWDVENVLRDELFELIQNQEDREKWIEIKIRSGTSPENFYHFYEINKALGLIKDKIHVGKARYSKQMLLEKLVFVCKYNNDIKALKDSLEYFCKHHKNDDDMIKQTFLNALNSNFDLSELSEGHWKYINKILHTQLMKKEDYRDRNRILVQYILYLWKSKNFVREKIVEIILNEDLFIKDLWNIEFNCIELERELVNIMEETLPQRIKDENELLEKSLELLYYIKWEDNSSKNNISLSNYSRLTNSIKTSTIKVLEEKNYTYRLHNLFKSYVPTKEKDEFHKSITEIYFEYGLENYTKESIILWYLINEPSFLLKYVDKIVKGLCTTLYPEQKLWIYAKKLTYLGLYEKSIQYCLENYTNGENTESMLQILAYLMYPEDYISVVSKYTPQSERIDLDDEDSKSNYKIEVAVAKVLKFTKSVAALPTLIHFCVGDYLRDALESLYYLFYHSPTNKLDGFLKELSNRAVSVRKHTFFLISQVGSVQSVFNSLKSAAEHEKNASIKKHLLNTTFRYFKKNPLDNFFELLITCIPFLNIVDEESLELIMSVRDIPEEFQGRYFMSILEYLRSVAEANPQMSQKADEFLGKLSDSIMKRLSYDFCISFIQRYFLEKDHCFTENNINMFARLFLFNCNHDFAEKLGIILEKLVKFHRDNSSELELKTEANRTIHFFVSRVISSFQYINSDKDIAHLEIFFNNFFNYFIIEEFFGEYINLKCLLIRKLSPDIKDYANKIYPFLNELTAKYTSNLTSNVANSIKSCLTYSETKDDTLYKLCFEFWKMNQYVYNSLLILLLLPNKIPNERHSEAYYDLLNSLEAQSDITVKIALNTYLQSLEIEKI